MRTSIISIIGAGILLMGLTACGAAPVARVAPAVAAATSTSAPATAVPPTAPVAASPTSQPTAAPAATQPPAPTAAPAAVAAVAFQIDATQSQVSFTLNEELFGTPTTVVGLTSDVSGVISVTQGNLGQTTIGPIRINARDLHTDEEMRNRAIRTFILQSSKDEYQYIIFEPTQIEGLPATVKTGEVATFKVSGNLKIRDIVKPATFDVTVTAKSDSELSGSAKAVVKRSDFDLNIPSVPAVANVSDEVALEFAFVAKKQ